MSVTPKRKILIVEDEPIMRLALVEVLSILEGIELLEAANGYEALEMIQQHNPELLILDLLMPKMDGFDVLRALDGREEPLSPKPRIVVMSALNEPLLVEGLRKLGADRVLVKPLHIDEIIDLVES